ncbi:unnamed protein product [Chondrus crispus]|uniref:Uncharacterized protein n=1 Tax=Chondrus crispus TaxID=2769 RepID=R7QPK1_CHOCR|nr:unnamed protein product [Chondrus crispus]CDF39708.1 unnamed protein product [Chondrus crispus]|eukprot:XP_005710002.1 unnamed protein product [Chondrus crispus]
MSYRRVNLVVFVKSFANVECDRHRLKQDRTIRENEKGDHTTRRVGRNGRMLLKIDIRDFFDCDFRGGNFELLENKVGHRGGVPFDMIESRDSVGVGRHC